MNSTIEELSNKINVLNNKVDTISESLQSNNSVCKRWLRTDEVCNYLSISSSQLQVLKNEGILNAVKIGGTNYYDRQAIDKFITYKFEEVQI